MMSAKLVFRMVLAALAILSFFVVWSELPLVVLGPAGAAGLWAWLLWGLIPEEEL